MWKDSLILKIGAHKSARSPGFLRIKISKMNQRRQTILVIFCISESVGLI